MGVKICVDFLAIGKIIAQIAMRGGARAEFAVLEMRDPK
jgi:hypothetical protein